MGIQMKIEIKVGGELRDALTFYIAKHAYLFIFLAKEDLFCNLLLLLVICSIVI